MTLTSLTIEPLTPGIGAEIPNLDLSEQLTDSVMKELEQALLDWKVLFFRDQTIDVEDQKRVARWFGELDIHPTSAPGAEHAELIRIAEDEKLRAHNDIWHSDVTFKASPPMGSILRALEMPPVGGDTMFADMYAAYEGLDDEIKVKIDNATALHVWPPGWVDIVMKWQNMDRKEFDHRFPNPEHPVVRTHPQTGRRSLFVNAAFTRQIIGMEKSESDELLTFLYIQATVPEYQCRFRWRKNSVAFWDNRCTQHYALADFYPQKRTVERITICGDKPV
ncbi:MAG: taurine dioxygenase [OM182 bacterium MED-G24]|uniref:Taurine dioxygenase n=1 Tax=OM182 bacterium MED-G24 TaxID=1986255 RepID=A0A2A5WVK9_9GAMM|nr:MAG: taurine dioxygenase [OM182 bacterium MED-G24]